MEDESRKLDAYSLKVGLLDALLFGTRSLFSLPQPLETDAASVFSGYSDESREYHLAISGDVFRWMMDFGALETLQRVCLHPCSPFTRR